MAKRNGSQGSALDPALAQKKRARRRLIGAAALLLAAAIVLPLVLDPEPRQQPPDVEVEIPSRETALKPPPPPEPDAQPQAASPAAGVAAGRSPDAGQAPPPAEPPASGQAAPGQPPAAVAEAAPAPAPARPSSSAKSSAQPADVRTAPAPAPAPSASAAAARPGASNSARFVLQIGAYANPDSARSMMERARKAGVRAYTESVDTSAGSRTRVRVGPFSDRESAERARGKLKLVGIDSSIVTLP
ncbi:SPOR domain-containing protein [Burkholderiaceae bacterium FT117]|uniref:SPOR domain-containing protein n=1 Tax=Zeimonas sediminis TaxID=2944268 RepID=UPI002342FC3E|nr:SPOR domain-containing protein [Zeimonas sediminis]MCM5569541.1 SPOR domain-containing protein [Zeimonas sediminis]